MRVLVLDTNIWDLLEVDDFARSRIDELTRAGKLEVLVPAVVRRELLLSRFEGVPQWFSTRVVADSVFILGETPLGEGALGDGVTYAEHLGASEKRADAIIVDTTDTLGATFVSADNRARERYARMRDASRALDYQRFRVDVLEVAARPPNAGWS